MLNGLHDGDGIDAAVRSATVRWMAWTINRRISCDYDMPSGLPYLLRIVIQCGIAEDDTAD